MQFKIITDGKQYKLLVKRFPFFWWVSELPEYDSAEDAKDAAFRVYGKVPESDTIVERIGKQEAQ